MRIKTVTYSMLRQTKQFEHVEIVELAETDDVAKAVRFAKETCERALKTTDYKGF